MYVVIGGAGEVGRALATNLIAEGHELAIIEKDPEHIPKTEHLDALVVQGNMASPSVQEKVNIGKADVFIGVTSVDELNLLACSNAHSRGVRTIARVNSPDYISEATTDAYAKTLGVDTAICPDLVAAKRIARIFQTPTLLDTDVIAGGKIHMLEAMVNRRAPAAGRRILDIGLPRECRVLAIFRGNEMHLPDAESRLMPRDIVALIVRGIENVATVGNLFGYSDEVIGKAQAEKVVVSGATRTGIDVAKTLQGQMQVTLVDPDPELCEAAAHQLNKTLVLRGSIQEEEILTDVDLATTDAFIALTAREDVNILQSLLAKQHGAKVTVALLDRLELKHTVMEVGVDVPISPRLATVNNILQHTHTVPQIVSLYVLQAGQARVLEIRVSKDSPLRHKTIAEAKFPDGAIVAAIMRGEEFILPDRKTALEKADQLVVLARADVVRKVAEML